MRQDGQASVELVALLPILAVVLLLLWQAVVAGQAIWLASAAARAAARAHAVGADTERAARAALPGRLEHGLRVVVADDGGVQVRVRIPAIVGSESLGTTVGRASLPSQTD